MRREQRYQGSLLGLAIGDALGVAVDGRPRGSFPPLSDMIGGGPHRLQPGQWTDSTAMAFCLATSLLERGRFDARDQLTRYLRWRDAGEFGCTGECVGLRPVTKTALSRFVRSNYPYAGSTDADSATSDPIARLAPVVIFFDPHYGVAVNFASLSCSTTHAALNCLDSARLMASILCNLFEGQEKSAALLEHQPKEFSPRVAELAEGAYFDKSLEVLSSGDNAVDSLEAALHCFHTTDSFRAAVLAAANLGGNASHIAAITGQIAGACYGNEAIPAEWRERIAMRKEIEELALRLGEHGQNDPTG